MLKPYENTNWQESFFENAPFSICFVEPEGNFVDVNRKWCAMLGYSRAELLRMNFRDITFAQDLYADEEMVGQVATGERSGYSMDKRYYTKEGETLWVTLSVNGVFRDKKHIGYVAWANPHSEERQLVCATMDAIQKEFRDQVRRGVKIALVLMAMYIIVEILVQKFI